MTMTQVMEEAAIDALVDSMELEGSGELVQFDEQTAQSVGQKSMYITSNAGKVRVWNVETGVSSDVLTTQLRSVLRTVFPADHPKLAGNRVYTLIEPGIKPRQGKILCRMHPNHPDRAFLDELGFRGVYCTKSNLMTERQAGLHMRKSHKEAYETVRDYEERQRADAAIGLQKQMVDSLQAIQGNAQPQQVKAEKPDTHFCEECGQGFKNAFGLKGHMRKHEKEA